ncbi:TPA: hypothetical protein HA235_05050 [Candidatus Woesearchaeota archaeon]|nr:hypothetical protein [Candidatus Woesearchaeota archaeon]HIH32049.1 hypothetical protein [Candidatus Woesearchaeota archaeon]HIH54993.1 hypothetical protein [Candidatus Woesearchaeota archaeon]HIJ01650.1 hypothetical protein [Candidatus Woesearchaeota archaeon]HIJ13357.1 hypothetical protein [Candidatus Woesearchaeota archaeon]
MGIFKNKSDLSAGPDVPIDQVTAMKGQGYTNNQIIQTLQRDGYTSSQIFDALSQSEMISSSPVHAPMEMPMQQQMPMPQASASNEELIEAVINEKWNDLIKDINKVIEWKQKADLKLTAMEGKVNDLRDQFDKLHAALLGKIGDYDKHMLDVASELQAMEKVFSKVLPTFMDNVNELSRITDTMRTQPKKTDKVVK